MLNIKSTNRSPALNNGKPNKQRLNKQVKINSYCLCSSNTDNSLTWRPCICDLVCFASFFQLMVTQMPSMKAVQLITLLEDMSTWAKLT